MFSVYFNKECNSLFTGSWPRLKTGSGFATLIQCYLTYVTNTFRPVKKHNINLDVKASWLCAVHYFKSRIWFTNKTLLAGPIHRLFQLHSAIVNARSRLTLIFIRFAEIFSSCLEYVSRPLESDVKWLQGRAWLGAKAQITPSFLGHSTLFCSGNTDKLLIMRPCPSAVYCFSNLLDR